MEQPGKGKKKAIGIALAIMVLFMVGAIIGYLRYRSFHIITDDAFVDGNINYISPQISGKVKEVLVDSNQLVEEGRVLVRIDTKDIEAELVAAKRNLDVVSNKIAGQYASIDVLDAQIKQLQAQRRLLSKEKKRLSTLLKKGAVSREDYDKLLAQWQANNAQIEATRKQKKQVEVSIGNKDPEGKEASVRFAEALIARIELQLEHAVIRSPVKGHVTRKNVTVGQVVTPGQPIMAVVSLDDLWIVANYKETELTDVRPGQPVTFKIDTYSGVKFSGVVDSIMAGTGSVFSLLPPENATGNYIKIVQRIPVKIKIIDVDTKKYPLRLGMSVVPTILTKAP